MKFNLFLLLLATLLAVGSPQDIRPGLYHIQEVNTNRYWAKAPYNTIRLQAEGELWEISTAGKSSYTISSVSRPKLSLTYQRPDNDLIVLSNATTTSPNLRWKLIPYGKNVAIQSIADPDSTQYVGTAHFSDGSDLLFSKTQPVVWRLISVKAKIHT